jgi:hypothetical protein
MNQARPDAASLPFPLLRLLWLVLPVAAGPVLRDLVAGRSIHVGAVLSVWAGLIWMSGLVALLVPHPIGLTVLRLTSPAVAGLGAAGLATGTGTGAAAVAAAAGVAVVALVNAPASVDRLVDGGSYGPERRMALRAPAALRLGPLPLAMVVFSGATLAGPLLLAARNWAVGAPTALAGAAVAVVAARAVHGLSKRWLVLVPAGLVVHDRFVLTDPVLVPARQMAALGPALVGTDSDDLSGGAPGLVVDLALLVPVELSRRTGRTTWSTGEVSGLLVTPLRPGTFLAEAAKRGLPVRRREAAGGGLADPAGPAQAPAQQASPPPTTSSPS